MTKENTAQQRAYYRMDTMLPMSYRILTSEEAHNPLPATADALFIEQYFPSALNELDERIEDAVNLIREKSAIMASALDALNEKLNFIVHGLGEHAIKHVLPTIPVNLSAGGLSFNLSQNVPVNSTIDFIIFLNINNDPLLIRAQVVKVVQNPDATFMVAVEFRNLNEEMRRQLVYFIQTKELEMAREKRGQQ